MNLEKTHTDPSPIWLSDHSYPNSWPNLYYTTGTLPWYFSDSVLRGVAAPPTYMYSFEISEGFDTDNDNFGDEEEDVAGSSPGATDSLDAESPGRRQALFLNGDAAARTRGAFLHEPQTFVNFTVEAWIYASNPGNGNEQVIVERPMSVIPGSPVIPTSIRLNYRLGLDASGQPFVEYTGSGDTPPGTDPRATASTPVPADTWVHLAGVFDIASQDLSLYVNGERVANLPSSEEPANGYTTGSPIPIFTAPIVVGARDNNPDGYVSGSAILAGPFVGLFPGGTAALNEPDLDNFF